MSDFRTFFNEDIEELNEFHQQHFELAIIYQCENGAIPFKGTITNLYLNPSDLLRTDNIRSTLTCFPRTKHLYMELELHKGVEETFTSEIFENFKSITIIMMSKYAVQFLPRINQFINPTTIKRISPSITEDRLLEEIAWKLGWELLPPMRLIDNIYHIQLLLKLSQR